MKRKLLMGLLMLGLTFGNGSAVLAAPVSMPDGVIFDADYYAQAYPDVTAAASENTITVCYDLLTSANGNDFNRLSPDAQYMFFIRSAANAELAGIFTNLADGRFVFAVNGGSQTFHLNDANQIWVIDNASGRLMPNAALPNGSYFIAAASTSVSSPTASNIFTINR